MSDSTFPTTVRIHGWSKGRIVDELHNYRVQLNQAARDLLHDPRFVPSDSVGLVKIRAVTVAELGFPDGATYPEFVQTAHGWGLVECPLELAPYLRMQFLDQPEAEGPIRSGEGRAPTGSIAIASPPLCEDVEVPKGFYLKHAEQTLWLRGYWSDFEHRWSAKDVLVFAEAEQG